jgi:hypothetical protein
VVVIGSSVKVMHNVSNIVRERLRIVAAESGHPDADALTAFAERSLTERERGRVLEHLALCRDCREVVALSLPELAETTVAMPSPARGWSWPALRWGLAVAGIAIVVSFGVMQYQRHSADTRVAQLTASKNDQPQRAAVPTVSESSQGQMVVPEKDPSAVSVASDETPSKKIVAEKETQHRVLSAPMKHLSAGGNLQSASGAAVAQNSQMGSVRVDINGASTIQTETASARPPAQLMGNNDTESVIRAKPAMTPQPLPGAPFSIPSWRISSSGGLERSFDQGETWQDVDVTASAAAGIEQPGSSSIVELAKAANQKKQAVIPTFRAVAAMGAEVWTGGAAGALYHSVDAGARWIQVVPISGGAVLSGDIVSIEFSDEQRGKVVTSDLAVWTTGDNGQTWQKQ